MDIYIIRIIYVYLYIYIYEFVYVFYCNYRVNYIRNMMKNHEWIQKTVDQLLEKNGESELFNRAFLKPIQITMKSWENQDDQQVRQIKRNQLPYGLKQVLKVDIRQNKYKLVDFQPIKEGSDAIQFAELRNNNWDNMISLLKGINPNGIKLAICVCMYTEDRTMLGRTISGISKNIAKFIQQGIKSQEIVVCVMMDGIQNIHDSVLGYIQQLQKESGVYLGNDMALTKLDWIMDDNNPQKLEQQQDQILNINHFIFEQEYEDRKIRQLSKRKRQYQETKKMIQRIEQLQNDKDVTFQNLENFIVNNFYDLIIQKHKEYYGLQLDLTDKIVKEMVHERYVDNPAICKPIIRQALNLTKRQCKKYIYTRQKLAILNAFRMHIDLEQTPQNRDQSQQLYNITFNQQQALQNKMNVLFFAKYKNGGKLCSHDWFFNGICEQLNPEFTILLDVGLSPDDDALVKMVRYMEKYERVGGVCGYMGIKIQRVQKKEEISSESLDCLTNLSLKVVDIQRAQQLQYHFAHLIDKSFESLFGFIHVLPGAFSGYRMKALKPNNNSDHDFPLLIEYFQSIKKETLQNYWIKKTQYSGIQAIGKVILPDFIYDCIWVLDRAGDESLLYRENIYLAEDRTMCLGIYLNGYTLQYLPDAYAWVDPMKTIHGLLGQRKRWINGSFFAFSKVKKDLQQASRSQFLLTLQIIFLQLMNMMAFIAPALFFYTLHFSVQAFFMLIAPGLSTLLGVENLLGLVSPLMYIVDFIYILIFLNLIYCSMHLSHKIQRFQSFLYSAATAYGIVSLIIYFILVYDIVSGLIGDTPFLIQDPNQVPSLTGNEDTDRALIISLRSMITGTSLGSYIVAILISLIFLKRCDIVIDIIFSTISFMFYASTYLNILNIYALCRIDDISWGTKGLDANPRVKQRSQNWKKIKILYVYKFLFWNCAIAFVLLVIEDVYLVKVYFTYAIIAILAITMFFKIILGFMYMCYYHCCRKVENPKNVKIQPDQVELTYKRVNNSLKRSIKKTIQEQVLDAMNSDSMMMSKFNKRSMGVLRNLSRIHKHSKIQSRKKLKAIVDQRSKVSLVPKKKSKKLQPLKKQTTNNITRLSNQSIHMLVSHQFPHKQSHKRESIL